MPSTAKWSALLNDADALRLGEDVHALEAAGCDEFEFELADGRYVPGYGAGSSAVKAVIKASANPVWVHLLAEDADRHIPALCALGVRGVCVPLETCRHAHRVVQQLHDAEIAAGVSVNPGTSLAALEYLLPNLDRVVLWMTEPGDGSRAPQANAFERVRILREFIKHLRRKLVIQVKGGLDIERAALALRRGADLLTLDRSNIFSGGDAAAQLEHFRTRVAAHEHLV